MGSGDTVTMQDMVRLSGLSRVSLKKIIANHLQPVGKVASGGRGRPAFLYDRQSFLDLMGDRTGKSATNSGAESSNRELSVDEIDNIVNQIGF